jgi:zinc transport system ATP-binding protein
MDVFNAAELRNATVKLGDVEVLREASLCLHQGSFTVVLGGNGTGKTTLIKAFLGLVPLSSGAATLLGFDVAALPSWERIAYAPQMVPDFSGVPISVTEFVVSGLFVRGPRWAKKPNIRQAMESLGLWDLRRRRMSEISGGQQRRALLARAVIKNPDLLFLDEPTAGVDEDGLDMLAAILLQRRRNQQVTLVVTHEHDAVHDLGTSFIVMKPPPGPSLERASATSPLSGVH